MQPLTDLIAHRVAGAQADWPEVHLDGALFGERLRRFAEEASDPPAALASLHASDLYLACACAAGNRAALAAFETHFLADIRRHISLVHAQATFLDDVRQRVREELLVAKDGRAPKIANFSGQGPLAGWLRVVAVRTALTMRRGRAASGSDADVDELDVASETVDPELDYLKARCRAEFKDAFVSAVATLAKEERTALRLHYLDGLTLEETASLQGVSRATVGRSLARARDLIVRETQRLLLARLGLDQRSYESVLRLVQSQLDVSMHRYLT
jgi:RNA polymerase sigma-70 factor (ECF subfamily)